MKYLTEYCPKYSARYLSEYCTMQIQNTMLPFSLQKKNILHTRSLDLRTFTFAFTEMLSRGKCILYGVNLVFIDISMLMSRVNLQSRDRVETGPGQI